jgi:very-short-patch-repair endonuclease
MTPQDLKSQLLEGKISFTAATHQLKTVADQLNQLYPAPGPLIQKFWLLVHDHNIDHAVCAKSGRWRRYKGWKDGFSEFCGNQGSCECNRAYRQESWSNRTPKLNQQSSIKRSATNLDRYGHEHASQHPEIKQKTAVTCMAKYGVPAATLNPAVLEKVKITNQQRYGVRFVQQNSEIRAKTRAIFEQQTGDSPNSEQWGEVAIKQWLQDNSIKFEQWNRQVISPRELDFWLPDHQVAIEFNGIWYHRHAALGDRNYHHTKWKMCHNQQIRLIQIWEHELLAKPEVIFDRLSHVLKLHHSRSVNARQCSIRPVEFDEAKPFVDMLHLQGHVPSSHAWGLTYHDQLVALASFVKSRYSKSAEWELARYCVASGTNVRGGLGKLISHAQKQIGFSSLVSYSNLNWGLGEGYAKTGFVLDHISKPNYWYFRGPKDVRSRVAFQKHKIQGQAAGSTESEIAANMGFERFFDAGNAVWIRRW